MEQRPEPPPTRVRQWKVVGWREWIGLPGLGVERIKAKLDTGARTSALHAFDLELFERDGAEWARFTIHPVQDATEPSVPVEVPLVGYRWVTSSTGEKQHRPTIATEIELQGERWTVEVTLARRDLMGFRMLLGRSALRKRLVVDPERSFLARKNRVHTEVWRVPRRR